MDDFLASHPALSMGLLLNEMEARLIALVLAEKSKELAQYKSVSDAQLSKQYIKELQERIKTFKTEHHDASKPESNYFFYTSKIWKH